MSKFDLSQMGVKDLVDLRDEIGVALARQKVQEQMPERRQGLLERLRGYKDREAAMKYADELKAQEKVDGLVKEIRALKPRIDELLETGRACFEGGISLNAQEDHHNNEAYDSYEEGTFETNAFSKRLGFVKNYSWEENDVFPYVALGLGGFGWYASGYDEYFMRTDGESISFVDRYGRESDAPLRSEDMERFLKEFDNFESAFYSFVDQVLEKQEREVEEKLGGLTEDYISKAKASQKSCQQNGFLFDLIEDAVATGRQQEQTKQEKLDLDGASKTSPETTNRKDKNLGWSFGM